MNPDYRGRRLPLNAENDIEEELEMNPRYGTTILNWLETLTTEDYNPWRNVDLRNALFDWAAPADSDGRWYSDVEDVEFWLTPIDLNELLFDTVNGSYDDLLDEETLDRAAMALELADPDILTMTDINHMVQAGFLGKVRY